MAKVKINADRVSWLEPSPIPNTAPVSVVGDFGAVVEMPDREAERLREVRTRRFYTDPVTGVPAALARLEPAVVDADAREEAEAEERASIDAEVEELRARIAELQANRPPTLVPAPPSSALPVTLTPATTGVRVLPAEGTPRTAEEAAAAGMPAPLISPEDRAAALAEGRTPEASTNGGASTSTSTSGADTPLADRSATDLINLLRDEPERADEVETAEQGRTTQRTSVLEAVARARA